ncbi:F-box protein At5g07610-like [Primulina tabacum]|uniref:F-box protein At5g07610-like n=1 Tax=Primulina tabacum TaxID=48773 RepID=UPI003F5AA4B7
MSTRQRDCHNTSGKLAWDGDVWIEILLWLPAKSLIRCKSVCKLWLSLISNLHFSRLHALRHPKPQPSLLMHTGRASQYLFYFHPILNRTAKLIPYHIPLPNPKILSSCNGLLLLQCDDLPRKDYYIYNPTTRESRKILLTANDGFPTVMGINLAFDPSKSPHYKVVCIRAARKSSSSGSRISEIEVYDSETRTWKLCIESFTAYIQVNFSRGVHWNNVIHWENFPSSHLYFDINKNVIGKLPHVQIPWPENPERGGGAACRCQLQESNGRLQHFIIMSNMGDKSIAVLELEEDYSGWEVKFVDRFGPLPGRTRVLSYIRGDGEENCTLMYHIPGEIRGYNFVEKWQNMVVDFKNEAFYDENNVQFEPRDVHIFGETLAPL